MCPEGLGYTEVACHPSSWCGEAFLSRVEAHRKEKLAFNPRTLWPPGTGASMRPPRALPAVPPRQVHALLGFQVAVRQHGGIKRQENLTLPMQ